MRVAPAGQRWAAVNTSMTAMRCKQALAYNAWNKVAMPACHSGGWVAAQASPRCHVDAEERMLDAAYHVFGQHGFRGATTRRIAEAAGVNEVTLFRHFPSKDALILAALQRQTRHTAAMLAAHALPAYPHDPRAELTAYAAMILHALNSSRQPLRTAIGEWGQHPDLDPHLHGTANAVYDEVYRYLQRAHAAGLLRADVEPLAATQVLLGALFTDALVREALPAFFPHDPARTVPAYLDVLLRGLLPAGERTDT